MAQYHARNQRNHSLPQRQLNREPPEDIRKNQRISSPVSSRLHENELLLRFDINMLLGLFNEMEVGGTGEVSWKGIRRILEAIGLQEHEDYLRVQTYTFDSFLSVVGEIEVPNESSVYVLSFVKILVHYRDRCLLNEEEGLEEAQAVQEKIRAISRNEVERQKARIVQEHSKIYEVMQKSQEKQFHSFEEEWKTYLKEFRGETVKRLHETKYLKKEKIIQEENLFLNKLKKSAVLTSPWLRQLVEKKKWLIHEKKFEEAIDVGHEINRERLKLNDFREEANELVLNKKLGKLASKTNRYIQTVENNLEMNFNRLISKKKEGETIMRIRMKKLQQEANRKLNDHYRTEVNRLKSSFYLATNR